MSLGARCFVLVLWFVALDDFREEILWAASGCFRGFAGQAWLARRRVAECCDSANRCLNGSDCCSACFESERVAVDTDRSSAGGVGVAPLKGSGLSSGRWELSAPCGRCLPEVPQRQAPFDGVPAVGLSSAVPPAGVQGDGAASHPCPNAEEDSIAVESHARRSPPVREERPFPSKVCLSPAAEEAAEGATSWDEFRGRRLFRSVHWFEGTARFGAGEAVVTKASKHGLRAEHISLDRDRDGVVLAADEPAESHLAWAREHKVDGAHAGFPCSTLSRLRCREQPVRDLEH